MKRGLTEDIALGNLGLEGSFEIQITNPLTGRPYYNRSYHNLVTNQMYSYLKQLCIASLSSMYNDKAALDMFSEGGLYCEYSNNNGLSIQSPIRNVYLTDGTQAAQANRRGIDGTIIARAGDETSATSGTVYGSLDTSTICASSSGVTKRWDWASSNGNGTMTKLCLGIGKFRGMMQLSGGLALPINSLYTLLNKTYDSVYIGGDGVYQLKRNSPTSVTVIKNTVSISDLTVHTVSYDITLPVAMDIYEKISLYATADHRYLYFCANRVSDRSIRYYRYDMTTGAVIASGEYAIDYVYNRGEEYGIQRILVGNDGAVRIIVKNYVYGIGFGYKLYTLHSDGTSSATPFQISGLSLKGCSIAEDSSFLFSYGDLIDGNAAQTVYRINKSTGDMDSYSIVPGTGYSNGIKIHLCIGGVNYVVVCTNQFTHAEPLSGNYYDPPCYITTEKLFTEPITKLDMPMFVKYTLNIV